MSRFFTETVTVVRAPLVADRYGNQVRDWVNATRAAVPGVNMQPASAPSDSDEDTEDRQLTVTGWRLYTPRGVDLDLLETDRVEWSGLRLEVAGKVGRWLTDGRVHHVEAQLKEVA